MTILILITTSRRPTKKVRTFIKELARVSPNSRVIQRGKASLRKLRDYMILNGFDKLIIAETWKGNPGRLQFFVLEEGKLKRKLIVYLKSLSMQIDLKKSFIASKLHVELDEKFINDEELKKLHKFMEKFFSENLILEEREGIECKFFISRADDKIWMGFLDAKTHKKIRPYFTSTKLVWGED